MIDLTFPTTFFTVALAMTIASIASISILKKEYWHNSLPDSIFRHVLFQLYCQLKVINRCQAIRNYQCITHKSKTSSICLQIIGLSSMVFYTQLGQTFAIDFRYSSSDKRHSL
ncbi:MAG: hypothetical protein LBB16_02660 [Puniceicoccales bacterium]|nr:hypothetical protein [Puniceicoccales bacterium]